MEQYVTLIGYDPEIAKRESRPLSPCGGRFATQFLTTITPTANFFPAYSAPQMTSLNRFSSFKPSTTST